MPESTRRPRCPTRRTSTGASSTSGAASRLAATSGQVPATASGPPATSSQAPVERVESRVLGGGAQRLGVDVEAERSRHAHQQRGQRQHARPGPHVEQRVGRGGLEGLLDGLEAHHRRRVEPGAERRRVGQPQDAGLGAGVSRHDPQAPDARRARAQDPDRSGVAADGGGDGEIVDAERAGHVLRRDAVGHQHGEAATGRALDVEGTEVDEAVERIGGGAGDVHAVGHAPA